MCLPYDTSLGSKKQVLQLLGGLKGMGELDAYLTWVRHFPWIKRAC